MRLPEILDRPLPEILERPSLTRLLQGACIGSLATVLLGFSWGGWMLGSTAREIAVNDMSRALVPVLAPMCADKLRNGPNGSLNLVGFRKVEPWQQPLYIIQKGDWAMVPGMRSPDFAIARECANIVAATP
jgi:hypothetical protein